MSRSTLHGCSSPSLPVETARLVLRPFTLDDLTELHSFYSRPDVARFLYWEPRDLDQVRAVLADKAATTELTDEGQVLCLAVTLRETGELIGEVLLFLAQPRTPPGRDRLRLPPGHHGRGYATEAAREILRLGFEGLGPAPDRGPLRRPQTPPRPR